MLLLMLKAALRYRRPTIRHLVSHRRASLKLCLQHLPTLLGFGRCASSRRRCCHRHRYWWRLVLHRWRLSGPRWRRCRRHNGRRWHSERVLRHTSRRRKRRRRWHLLMYIKASELRGSRLHIVGTLLQFASHHLGLRSGNSEPILVATGRPTEREATRLGAHLEAVHCGTCRIGLLAQAERNERTVLVRAQAQPYNVAKRRKNRSQV